MEYGRLGLALHVPQELIPLAGAGSSTNLPPSRVVGTGSGYGPPIAPSGTPLSRLVSSTLYTPYVSPTPAEAALGYTAAGGEKTEYDLVCVPITNGNWHERWKRMCTISASGTEFDLGIVQAMGTEDGAGREAESWRAGGAFGRGEVNITRSGESLELLVYGGHPNEKN